MWGGPLYTTYPASWTNPSSSPVGCGHTNTNAATSQSPLTHHCQCQSNSVKQTGRSGVISSEPISKKKPQVANLRTSSPYLNYARGGASCYFQSSSDSFVSTTSHNQIHKYVVIFALALRAVFLLYLFPPSSLSGFTFVSMSPNKTGPAQTGGWDRSGVNHHVLELVSHVAMAVWPRGSAKHIPTVTLAGLGISCCSSTGGVGVQGELQTKGRPHNWRLKSPPLATFPSQ